MTDTLHQPVGSESSLASTPRHVAIIMDGNGRWASKRHLPRLAGHRAGTENIRRVIRHFADNDVKYLTLYAFSTENWNRPDAEVSGLMELIADVIDQETAELDRNGARIVHVGREDGLSERLLAKVRRATEVTGHNDRITVNVAFNYGGRAEIIDAVRRMTADGVASEDITEEMLGRYLYTDSPDPDLVIRTAGEMRLSNFLIWQAAYAEYYSTPVFWPDFSAEEIDAALSAYAQRQRRFGGLTAQ